MIDTDGEHRSAGDIAGDGDSRYSQRQPSATGRTGRRSFGRSFPGMGNNMGPNNPLTSAYHVGGVQVAMGDGSVRFITEEYGTGKPEAAGDAR